VSDLAGNRRGIDGDNDAVGLARARGRPNRASKPNLLGLESCRYLLGFGFTPEVYAKQAELQKVDVGEVDAPISSHGHHEHVGGLISFLLTRR
jgi:glyoxylase-like metal-dependent hydrolase (beta-lactamase superfamily II)